MKTRPRNPRLGLSEGSKKIIHHASHKAMGACGKLYPMNQGVKKHDACIDTVFMLTHQLLNEDKITNRDMNRIIELASMNCAAGKDPDGCQAGTKFFDLAFIEEMNARRIHPDTGISGKRKRRRR